MCKLCLSGFHLVALFCCLVAPPFAVYNSLNQDERQHVRTFIASLAVYLVIVKANLLLWPQRQEVTYSVTDDDNTLTASTVTGQTGSPLAEVEEEIDFS